jgi:prophage antirepressor-like protein
MNTFHTQFCDINVSIIDHNGKKWLTAKQLGLCLSYEASRANDAITRIYQRHMEEFSELDTVIVKLTVNLQGGNPTTRIFSESGCVLLSMFANTSRAKEFRAWAKQVLTGTLPALPVTEAPVSLESRVENIEHVMTRMAHHMGTLVEVSAQQAQKLEVTARYIGLLEINQKGRVKITRTVEAQVLALKAQGMANADIGRMLRISPTSVCLLIKGRYALPQQEANKLPVTVEELLENMVAEEQKQLLGKLGEGA